MQSGIPCCSRSVANCPSAQEIADAIDMSGSTDRSDDVDNGSIEGAPNDSRTNQTAPGSSQGTRRRIVVTAIILGLVALGFYLAEILIVVFGASSH